MQDSSDPTPGLPRSAPPIYAEQVVARPVEPPPKNRLGVVAFVFSILGVTCLPVIGGVVGLICGIIAVRREPRGLSIAAIVISVVGGCLLMPLLLLPALLLPALAKARAAAQAARNQVVQGSQATTVSESTVTVGSESTVTVSINGAQFVIKNGRMPKSIEEIYPDGVPTDSWGKPLRIEVSEDPSNRGFAIWSAGPDGAVGTSDDERTVWISLPAPADAATMPEPDADDSDADEPDADDASASDATAGSGGR